MWEWELRLWISCKEAFCWKGTRYWKVFQLLWRKFFTPSLTNSETFIYDTCSEPNFKFKQSRHCDIKFIIWRGSRSKDTYLIVLVMSTHFLVTFWCLKNSTVINFTVVTALPILRILWLAKHTIRLHNWFAPAKLVVSRHVWWPTKCQFKHEKKWKLRNDFHAFIDGRCSFKFSNL